MGTNGTRSDRPVIPWEELVRRRTVLSPLRYPGGKRRLVPYVAAALEANALRPELFVEPFAGGASVALELAEADAVERIGIADLDPYVAAFWRTAFFDCDWLCHQVERIEVSLATWERMKGARYTAARSMALACLFLNRTSFNGTLHRRAGPIGGKAGESDYAIACRFPRERLVRRLRACEELARDGRVAFVHCASALETIRYARTIASRNEGSLFFYFDPPFWAKSHRLYRYSFEDPDHEAFSESLHQVREPYLLSYDPAPEVGSLYASHEVQIETIELFYAATQRSAGRELMISNLRVLPADTKLWRTNGEWRKLRMASEPFPS
jgi:DNA adenine methylase